MGENTKNIAYRSKDIPMFVSTDPNKLAAVNFVGDVKVMGDIKGCRIPSIINAKEADGSGVLIAAGDIGNEGVDWGNISLAIRRSYDGGKNWTNPQKVISLQAHHAPQEWNDWQSPFIIDPLMVQAEDGKIIIMVDMYPESQGLRSTGWLESGTGYKKIGEKEYLALYDGESKIGGNESIGSGNEYTVREKGWIYDSEGKKTNYYMPQKHASEHGFATIGDLYYAIGEADYIDVEPPLIPDSPTELDDIYVGNVFMSFEKPKFNQETPEFVTKRIAGPNEATYSNYRVVETDPAPLRAKVTSYLWVTISEDGGKTWTQPTDINPQVKEEEDGVFLGVGPGAGIVLTHQKELHKNGRIMMPLYNVTKRENRATVIYSDDNGQSWKRTSGSKFINNKDEVQCIELYNGTIVSFGRQEGKGDTPISLSKDGGETWGEQLTVPLTSVTCQKSIITYPIDNGENSNSNFTYPEGLIAGKQYVISSHPTGESGYTHSERSDGTISLGEVLEDSTINWIAHKKLAIEGQYDAAGEDYLCNFFAYSCLCVLDNGNIGILYEPQPKNYLAYAEFNLAWILE